jgi:hypothetical protein
MIEILQQTLKQITETLPPNFIVGNPDDPYLLRWFLIKQEEHGKPRAYIHKFIKSDWDRALHDHASKSVSLLFEGEYLEHTPKGVTHWKAPAIIFRDAETPHRIELIDNKPAYTLFFFGDKERDWGFHCPKSWVHWEDFVDKNDFGNVGKGCPE